MSKTKIILMGAAMAALVIVAGFSLSVPMDMSARGETSEVTRLLSESEFTAFQIAFIMIGLLAMGSALVLLRKVWRILRSRKAKT